MSDGSITILIPTITQADFSINPISINASTLVQVSVSETQKTLYPSFKYCGTIRCGVR
jgi:hypothetical protein